MPGLTITINVHPYADEDLADLLADLGERLDGFATVAYPILYDGEPTEEESESATGATKPRGWTDKRADKFVALLRPDARKALHYICTHTPETPVEDVITELGLGNGTQLGGRMSSIGHAMNRMPKGLWWPTERHGDVYVTEPEVAKILLAAFDRYTAKHAV